MMKRSNFQWLRHAVALSAAGLLAFNLIRWAKSDSKKQEEIN